MRTFFSAVAKLLSLEACKRRHCKRFTVDIRASPSVHCEPLPQSGGQESNNNSRILFATVQNAANSTGTQTTSHLHTPSTASVGEGGFRSFLDYFSRCVQALSSTTSASVIRALKAIFFRHSIPTTLVSDNRPQYSSQEFQGFSQEYNLTHTTSSLHCPQSNDLAGRMVKTVKSLLFVIRFILSIACLQEHSTTLVWIQPC